MPFLALQYWQTVLLLHRNAILLNSALVISSAEKYCANKPYRSRIRNGYSICCNAARSITSILNDSNECGATSILLSSFAPLIAVYALVSASVVKLSMVLTDITRAFISSRTHNLGLPGLTQRYVSTYL